MNIIKNNSKEKIVAIIPARYASTRFPGKPLAMIAGKPMIQWVYEAVRSVSELDGVYVATDDERIEKCVEGFGGNCLMTSKNHQSGSDRLAECVGMLGLLGEDIVLNIQGDEPLIKPEMIRELLSTIRDKDECMGTLKELINDEATLKNPNVVKVITDLQDHALYFSRSVIPYNRNGKVPYNVYRHVGVYAYKAGFLLEFTQMPRSYLEMLESLEQLRALENGYRICVKETAYASVGIDTPEQLKEVERMVTNGEE